MLHYDQIYMPNTTTANTYSGNTLSFSTGITTQTYQCSSTKEEWMSPSYGIKTHHISPPTPYRSTKGVGGSICNFYFGNFVASKNSEPDYDWC